LAKENKRIVYKDVAENVQALEEMLKLTAGTRRVPVLVEAGKVTIGFRGS
jgi:hypothetical protein